MFFSAACMEARRLAFVLARLGLGLIQGLYTAHNDNQASFTPVLDWARTFSTLQGNTRPLALDRCTFAVEHNQLRDSGRFAEGFSLIGNGLFGFRDGRI